MTNKEKQDYAWLLYKDGNLTQKLIAERVGVSEKTIGKWKEEFGWEEKKRNLYASREELLRDLYLIFENTKNAINDKGGVANSKDADALLKLSASIKNLETDTSINQIFEVCKGLVLHIQAIDTDKAKDLIEYIDSYMQTKLK